MGACGSERAHSRCGLTGPEHTDARCTILTRAVSAWNRPAVHCVRSLKRNILFPVGIGPNRHTLIGMTDAKRTAWIRAMRRRGKRAR